MIGLRLLGVLAVVMALAEKTERTPQETLEKKLEFVRSEARKVSHRPYKLLVKQIKEDHRFLKSFEDKYKSFIQDDESTEDE
jgi:hypothetical protein